MSTGNAARVPGCCSTTSYAVTVRSPVTSPAINARSTPIAAAVAAGRADAGLGIRSATRTFGLDFVPVAHEPYDLVLTKQTYDSPLLAPLWSLLADEAFRASITALGGYSTAETGRRIL
jgi:molybdate-binding protein